METTSLFYKWSEREKYSKQYCDTIKILHIFKVIIIICLDIKYHMISQRDVL